MKLRTIQDITLIMNGSTAPGAKPTVINQRRLSSWTSQYSHALWPRCWLCPPCPSRPGPPPGLSRQYRACSATDMYAPMTRDYPASWQRRISVRRLLQTRCSRRAMSIWLNSPLPTVFSAMWRNDCAVKIDIMARTDSAPGRYLKSTQSCSSANNGDEKRPQ